MIEYLAQRKGSPAGRPFGPVDRILLGVILRLAGDLRRGTLDLRMPQGETLHFTGRVPGPHGQMTLHRPGVAWKYVTNGAVGFAEAFMDGDFDSPDLATLLELLNLNADAWGEGYYGSLPSRLMRSLHHRRNANTRRGSRRNILAHYDLGNRFFSAWLDPTMTYSAALFEDGATDLESAQRAKYENLCRMIALQPDQRLLEIGSGWGGFALHAAGERGAKVTSVTISHAQHDMVARRVQEAGLNERIEVRLQDYREIDGRFDRIASIEMFEAVGERYWPTFFDRLRERLAPGGLAGLQIITIADEYFEAYRRSADFIQRYVFPGGMLPSPAALKRELGRAGLIEAGMRAFGGDYARTLGLWNARFHDAWDELRQEGFDERFRRLWHYYLAYCEAGFRSKSTDVVQLALKRA
ncbi:MAG: class I SAM-dependent methyltransferase [Geminicoccaceae bacterium]|nr:class I SAM-dependent methyltransferase [Geminicoccaceae bacterium]